jgi:hypothetical protein
MIDPTTPTRTQGKIKTKIMVLVFSDDDYKTLLEMHVAAADKIPGISIDQTCSTLLTQAIRQYREQHPALPCLPETSKS